MIRLRTREDKCEMKLIICMEDAVDNEIIPSYFPLSGLAGIGMRQGSRNYPDANLGRTSI